MANTVEFSERKQFTSYVDVDICSHRVHDVSFRMFTDDEIQRLSVKEIRQTETFDCLGHATVGGLYDLELGPQRVEGPCITCGLNFQDALPLHRHLCPGHMGFVKLPVPVFNPVLFKQLFSLLQAMCFKCYHLRISIADGCLFTYQMEALNSGLISTVSDMKDIFSEISRPSDLFINEERQRRKNSGHNFTQRVCEELKDRLALCLKEAQNVAGTMDRKPAVKNIIEMQQILIKKLLYDCRGACVHCGSPVRPLRQEGCTKIFYGRMPKVAKSRILKQMPTDPISEEIVAGDKAMDRLSTNEQIVIYPLEVRTLLRKLWDKDKSVLSHVVTALGINGGNLKYPVDMFFRQTQPVHPTRFRPPLELKSYKMAHAETDTLLQVLKQAQKVEDLVKQMQTAGSGLQKDDHAKLMESLKLAWQGLQGRVNCMYDSNLGKMFMDSKPTQGVKQRLERKEGLFRWNMMGKRVDFAARSVISPDPCIATNEVGIPLYFAKRLTYPESVTAHNVQYLRQAVINGPDVYPGATHIVFPSGEKKILNRASKLQRAAIAKQLLVPVANSDSSSPNIKVLRHIRNGDVLFMNRQPSLHRPSMQAHKARILPQLVEEKTLRMHYANCKAYNADFDGDEMNAHFPQNELARAECYQLACTDFQYLVPKDGTPLAGLIQDYMVSGVWLMVRGQFFNQDDYQQLVYSALIDHPQRVHLLKPAIVRPARLWSGKQVVSTLLLNLIPQGKPPLSLVGKASIAEKKWAQAKPRRWRAGGTPLSGNNMTESEVVILNGHLLVGVLDKAHYGASPYGLVHCCYELYGGRTAGQLLTCLARLFNWFLQFRGFTMGVEDIIVQHAGNAKRRDLLDACDVCGPEAAILAFGLSAESSTADIEGAWRHDHFSQHGDDTLKRLDCIMNKKTNDCQDFIKRIIMPEKDEDMPGELLKTFPRNNLQMMFLSGAKGTQVNCVQISCTLGQISLEGRRPPLMLNGASLPSYLPYDVSPKAGGFVAGRFLTGLRPQEYFFHCMAGREGLVDTAVKTSHSGYLQRCLIKHLEGLTVAYDMTVRDGDGSVIQFCYGEDGLDVMKTSFIRRARASDKFPQFPFLIANRSVVANSQQLSDVKSKMDTTSAAKLKQKIVEWNHLHSKYHNTPHLTPFLAFCRKKWSRVIQEVSQSSACESSADIAKLCKDELVKKWQKLPADEKLALQKRWTSQPDPVNSQLRSDRYFGSISESIDRLIDDYISHNPDRMLYDKKPKGTDGKGSSRGECQKTSLQPMPSCDFPELIHYKYQCSLVHAGEMVGLLAAQSIGEPSTQMTLNTFHFAGHQAMNVTLGIPRLREILMTASVDIKTPIMEIPVLNTPEAHSEAEHIAKKLTSISLTSLLKKLHIDTYLAPEPFVNHRCQFFKVHFEFHKRKYYRDWSILTPGAILAFMERLFFMRLTRSIEKHIRETKNTTLLHTSKVTVERNTSNNDTEAEEKITTKEDDNDENDDDNEGDDDDLKHNSSEKDYEDDEEYEEKEEDDEENLFDEMAESESEDADKDKDADVDEENGHNVVYKTTKRVDTVRVSNVLARVPHASHYTYDADHQLWCEVTFKYDLMDKSIDVTTVIEKEASNAILCQTPGIVRASAKRRKEDKELMLRTEGLNIQEMYKYSKTLDLNRLYTNNIHTMAEHYGIEAAYQAIIKEINSVFELYKITVDRRHLSLIADYMTFEGRFKAFNRLGLETNASPFQKMSFETVMQFLKDAIVNGSVDELASPSARIAVGRVMKAGTGYLDVTMRVI